MLYSLALYLISPLFFCYLLCRGLRDRDYWQRWSERLGLSGPEVAAGGIVVHAVSVGEVNAAESLIRALLQQYPDRPLTVTCFTPTGSKRIKALFGPAVAHCYLPMDLPGAVKRFLHRIRPALLVIMETEIWPNLYAACDRKGIPMLLANARISNGSFSSYGKFHRLTAQTLGRLSRVGAQSAEDARRLLELGAQPDRTVVSGNLKFDISIDPDLINQGQALRERWGNKRLVLLAASTRDGEEKPVLEAFRALLTDFPQALLVVVPRHPERFSAVAGMIDASGLVYAKFSQPDAELASVSCYLVDAMGQLMSFYAACDVAFVGGSLANTGGHNVLEAAMLAKPVLVGPNTFNFADITQELVAHGGAMRVEDAASLRVAVSALFLDQQKRLNMGLAGQAWATGGQGALNRTLGLVKETLDHSSS
jgi:3-deoxy-D-manno-octulosonic-acid transferase